MTVRADHSCCLTTHPLKKCRIHEDRMSMMKETCEGQSLKELLETALDETVEAIFTTIKNASSMDDSAEELEVAGLQGKARGIALAIAIILHPYLPQPDAVRDEAMERYYAAHPEELEDD